jgi:hypothetical protein
MAILYTDSSSFSDLKISGSTVMSASRGIALQVKSSGSTIFSVSGSGGEIFNISDVGSSTALFTVSSGSTTILNVDNTKNVSVSGSLVVTGSAYIKGLGTTTQTNVVTIDTTTGQLYYTASSAFGGGGGGSTFPFTGNAVITGSLLVSGSSSGLSGITGSLQGTASWAQSASNAINSITASFLPVATYQITSSWAVSASRATTASFVTLTGLGITVNGTQLTASVRQVNGNNPDSTGNVSVALSKTITGLSASLIASSSGAVTASLTDASIWIIATETLPSASLNGLTYIWSSGSRQWYLLPRLDQAAADVRYLQLAGGTMAGNITMSSGYSLIGTASWAQSSSNAISSQTASYLPVATYQITSSWAVSASQAISASQSTSSSYASTASYALNTATPSLIATGSTTASVNVNTASYFQVVSGSNQFLLVRDAANLGYNWSGYSWSTNNSLSIYSAGFIRIGNTANNSVTFTTNTIDRWSINGSGNFIPSTSNTYDIGDSTNQVRNIYVSNSVIITGSLNATGSVSFKGLGTTSQTNVVTIDSTTGQLYYTASSAFGGGGSSTPTSYIATGSITASVNVNSASFQVTSGSSTFMFISSSGNVGIGTTTPSYSLDVASLVGGRFAGPVYLNGDNGSFLNVAAFVKNSRYFTFEYSTNSGQVGYQLQQDSSQKFHIRNGNWGWNVMTFLDTPQISGSAIGINNVSPSYTLDLSGSYTSGSLRVNNVLYVSGSNVGINKSNPSYRLHVSGNVYLNGWADDPAAGGYTTDWGQSVGTSIYFSNPQSGVGLKVGGGATGTSRLLLQSDNTLIAPGVTAVGFGGIFAPTAQLHITSSGNTSATVLFRIDNSEKKLLDIKADGSTTLTGSFAMSGSSLTIDIPSKANNYVLKSDANGGATWDSIYNIIGNYIYSGSVTASVNVATASYFQITSGSGTNNSLFLVRDAVNLGYNWSGYSWSTNNSLSIYSSAGAVRIGTTSNNSLSLTTNASDRWQVNTSGHFIAGSENAYDIGTSTTGKVRNIYVTGSIVTTGSVTINDVLVLPYQNPLPSGKPTGSIATSGSGATFVGLYLYNGTSWIKLSV